jgi:hypothetical protein
LKLTINIPAIPVKYSLLIVAFLSLPFASCTKGKTEEKSSVKMPGYQENLDDMKIKTASLIAHMRQYKVEEEDELRLSCFFYTDKQENMLILADTLKVMEYPVNAGEHSKEKPFLIAAQSDYMKMDEATITSWVEQMCKLAHRNRCVMEGWSVNPKQPRKPIYE